MIAIENVDIHTIIVTNRSFLLNNNNCKFYIQMHLLMIYVINDYLIITNRSFLLNNNNCKFYIHMHLHTCKV